MSPVALKVLVAGSYNSALAIGLFWSPIPPAISTCPISGPAVIKVAVCSRRAVVMLARTYQSTTALHDGRVLIAGGTDAGDQALGTAELYDPATGKFALTRAPMQHARYRQVAVLLPDGDVLLAGGASNVGALANAEIFDPRTDKFRPTGLMKDFRMAAGAVLLHNGTVFIAGGYNNRPSYAPGAANMGMASVPFRVLNTAEIYNPVSGQFVDTRSLGRGPG
jgi:hypothetical protein